jgi:hypothetical protein
VVLGHDAAALLVFAAFAVIVAARWAFEGRSGRTLLAGLATMTAALAFSAFFWIPALVERPLVKVDLLRGSVLDWRQHAVDPGQLLWSPWGYGVSGPGASDGMSFALGPAQLFLGLAGLVLLVRRSSEPRRRAEGVAFGLIALGARGWPPPSPRRSGNVPRPCGSCPTRGRP